LRSHSSSFLSLEPIFELVAEWSAVRSTNIDFGAARPPHIGPVAEPICPDLRLQAHRRRSQKFGQYVKLEVSRTGKELT